MSQAELERPQKNPLEESEGLDYQGNFDAKYDYKKYKSSVDRSRTSHKPTYADGLGFGIVDSMSDRSNIRYALNEAFRNYKKNEGAYQEQAVKDAADRGVHTSFGMGSTNQLADMEGLSDEDNEKALQLRKQLKGAVAHERSLRKRSLEDYHRSFGREVNEMIEELQTKRNIHKLNKSAKKHYQENEGRYQIQAVKDASAEGVEINFGNRE